MISWLCPGGMVASTPRPASFLATLDVANCHHSTNENRIRGNCCSFLFPWHSHCIPVTLNANCMRGQLDLLTITMAMLDYISEQYPE